MDRYYKVAQFLFQQLIDDPNVNTVAFGNLDNVDLNKKTIYPLAYLNVLSAPMNTSYVDTFTFEVAVLDQRDISNSPIIDKFNGNDNLQDNLNICHAILSKLVKYLRENHNEDGIELESVTAATPILQPTVNLLDGWLLNMTLKIENIQC
jgi:hypothetical protein